MSIYDNDLTERHVLSSMAIRSIRLSFIYIYGFLATRKKIPITIVLFQGI